MLLEAEVHASLKDYYREYNRPIWSHHLTMARLVARALRYGRSALIETGTVMKCYCLSYLIPALLSPDPVLLVVPLALREQLMAEIQPLQRWLETNKPVVWGEQWSNFRGLMLTSPQIWLGDRLRGEGRFPTDIPTLIEQGEDLETWTRDVLTRSLNPGDWQELLTNAQNYQEMVRDVQVKLTKSLFDHPPNPYDAYVIEPQHHNYLEQLLQTLETKIPLSSSWQKFWHQWQNHSRMLWGTVDRQKGQFSLYLAPGEVGDLLAPIWQKQPIVVMGQFFDWEVNAPNYRPTVGLNQDLLCLKFAQNRQQQEIQLYLPSIPFPNSPEFQPALLQQFRQLITATKQGQIILLVADVPLRARVGTILAAEFGSRVQVEQLTNQEEGILITGWDFWRQHQGAFPNPQVLAIATLPFPSPENPLVASRVTYYQQNHRNWFQDYLLPTAVREMQKGILPLRQSQGVVAIFDNRLQYRSYGSIFLKALEPYARLSYFEPI